MNASSNSNEPTTTSLAFADQWHQQWKERLRSAVANHETLDTETIRKDDCCELGKWIYTDGHKTFWGKPGFQSLLLHHREFHMLAGAISELINAKQYALAEAYLSDDTQFAQASNEVSQALLLLQDTGPSQST